MGKIELRREQAEVTRLKDAALHPTLVKPVGSTGRTPASHVDSVESKSNHLVDKTTPRGQLPVVSYKAAVASSPSEYSFAFVQEQVKKAKNNSADIIVFPENGGFNHTFEYGNESKTLAKDCDSVPDDDHQTRLSCLALAHKIYIVVNVIDIQKCPTSDDVDDDAPEDVKLMCPKKCY